MAKEVKKVVLAYSGGLDTSVIVKWVKETYNAEVICYCADVGQEEELTGLDAKAKATGATHPKRRCSRQPRREPTPPRDPQGNRGRLPPNSHQAKREGHEAPCRRRQPGKGWDPGIHEAHRRSEGSARLPHAAIE